MLKADRLALEIITLALESSEHRCSFALPDLTTHLSQPVGTVSSAETVDALLVLYEDGFIALGRYVNSVYVPYDPNEGRGYFYTGQFQFSARPKARRHAEELSKGSRNGIFISHISEERVIALRLKQLLETALSPPVPVFVSSDYESIQSGAPWWNAILEGIRRSQSVIVLLSRSSIDRRWINFEAGFGLGQDSYVMPVVWRGLGKGNVGMPLGQLQARELSDEPELKALLNTVAANCHVRVTEGPIADFLSDLQSLETQVPNCELDVSIYLEGLVLVTTIRNTGNRPLDMIDAEMLVPQELCPNTQFQSYEPLRETRTFEEDGIRFIGFRLTTLPFSRPHLGINPLRPTIMPGIEEITLDGLGIVFPHPLSGDDLSLPVRYRVSARQVSVGPAKKCLRDIHPRRGSSFPP